MNDLIRRSDAIDAIDEITWYHKNCNKDIVSGANPDEHQAWVKVDDVCKAIELLSSAKQWIPCEDEPPTIVPCLVCLTEASYPRVRYCYDIYTYDTKKYGTFHVTGSTHDMLERIARDEGREFTLETVYQKRIIAWMPLPEPYKGGKIMNDLISRQDAIKAIKGTGCGGSATRTAMYIKELENLPSAQPEPISEAYAKAVRSWLVNYQVKCAELQGGYTPYEVLGWIVSDWRKDNGIW